MPLPITKIVLNYSGNLNVWVLYSLDKAGLPTHSIATIANSHYLGLMGLYKLRRRKRRRRRRRRRSRRRILMSDIL